MNENFLKKYRNLFGSESEVFFDALHKKREKFFRINSARKINYIEELVNLNISKDSLPFIYSYISENDIVTNTVSFLTGGIYIQNPSSIIPPLILSSLLDENSTILDISAAPGGKTTSLSEITNRKSTIIANEPSSTRLKSLHFNLEKYGAWNVHTISFDGRILDKKLPAVFDGILLDAPCSNENKIGYNKEVNSSWSEELVLKMQKLQYEIISSAVKLLKDGGILIYSTCTFSIEENEEIIKMVIDSNDDLELIDINKGEYDPGISEYDWINEKVIRVLPHKSRYDGFFVAGIRKKGELHINKLKESSPTPKYLKEYFDRDTFEGFFSEIDGIVYYEKKLPEELNRIKYKKTGIKLGKIVRNEVELSSQFLWEYGFFLNKDKKIDIDIEKSLEFLSGFDVELKVKINKNCLFFGSIPVGIVKNLGNCLKNKLDRYFLYGKGM
ncbi:MAG: RsmB/NOP family class I SAM-dependent RNA methyltransferase [Calditerrivibrio sp.]|nr:RsmB/NOP family class I SAM-dependent RNA methyltransferase [Calditerrivibrio sp.]MCA1932121.1 RsmB/NOP family class I SAM-dependent RNA methyltransferase [Calditerrivibrio sp.]